MINLAGKTAVVFGLANKRSIAWGIAQKLHEAGATLAICYQNERMKAEAQDLIADLPGAKGFQCDVSNDAEIDTLFAALKETYAKLDILVHAVAFAPATELRGDFINTSRDGFRVAMDVSVYSLIAVSRGAAPLMTATSEADMAATNPSLARMVKVRSSEAISSRLTRGRRTVNTSRLSAGTRSRNSAA